MATKRNGPEVQEKDVSQKKKTKAEEKKNWSDEEVDIRQCNKDIALQSKQMFEGPRKPYNKIKLKCWMNNIYTEVSFQ